MSTWFRPLFAFVALSLFPAPGLVFAAEAAATAAGKLAAEFINAYVAVSLRPGGNTGAFVEGSPVVTERFKRALDKLYRDALAKDPELGHGADAVIGGQDCPERFRVKSSKVNGERARVLLVGEDPGFPMEVKVELVLEDGRWMVDASGDLVSD